MIYVGLGMMFIAFGCIVLLALCQAASLKAPLSAGGSGARANPPLPPQTTDVDRNEVAS